MPKKAGDLRLLKSGAVYGPMSRDEFDRLRSGGKVGLDELVSLRGGAWMTVAVFLASSTAANVPETQVASPIEPTETLGGGDNDAVLRLLTGKRIVTALSRAEVNQLHQSGRLNDDDLICALDGPWMCVGDFLAPPRSKPPVILLDEQGGTPHAARAVVPVPAQPSQPAPPPIAPLVIAGPTAPIVSPVLSAAVLCASSLLDEWFVRVRGIHSAPLGKRHVKALFEAKEITRDNVARHASWPDNAWFPLHSIAQLADAVA